MFINQVGLVLEVSGMGRCAEGRRGICREGSEADGKADVAAVGTRKALVRWARSASGSGRGCVDVNL